MKIKEKTNAKSLFSRWILFKRRVVLELNRNTFVNLVLIEIQIETYNEKSLRGTEKGRERKRKKNKEK